MNGETRKLKSLSVDGELVLAWLQAAIVGNVLPPDVRLVAVQSPIGSRRVVLVLSSEAFPPVPMGGEPPHVPPPKLGEWRGAGGALLVPESTGARRTCHAQVDQPQGKYDTSKP